MLIDRDKLIASCRCLQGNVFCCLHCKHNRFGEDETDCLRRVIGHWTNNILTCKVGAIIEVRGRLDQHLYAIGYFEAEYEDLISLMVTHTSTKAFNKDSFIFRVVEDK